MEAYTSTEHDMLTLKPNFSESAKRWEAYWNHDIIDRPILCANVLKPDAKPLGYISYRDRVYGDLDNVLAHQLHDAACYDWLGESIPSFFPSLGTHEIACYCGYEIEWGQDGMDTNWCKHSDKPLAELLPITLDTDGFWFKRITEVYRKAYQTFHGQVIPNAFDFHTNLDLLLSIRGDSNLCLDTFDCPEDIDRAMTYTYEVFEELWTLFVTESGCDQTGYFFDLFSEKPTSILACDFSALIGVEMFNRWARPALEFESGLVGDRSIYHWDGPDAIKHKDELLSIKNLHTFSYVPGPNTYHHQFLELYLYCQERGKGIIYTAGPDEIKAAHSVLNPTLTCYRTWVNSIAEFEELEKWFRSHT